MMCKTYFCDWCQAEEKPGLMRRIIMTHLLDRNEQTLNAEICLKCETLVLNAAQRSAVAAQDLRDLTPKT